MADDSLDLAALGRVIAVERERLGWNVHRLSQRAGVGDAYLRRLEAGQTSRVGLDILGRIGRALRVPVGDMLRRAGMEGDFVDRGEVISLINDLGDIERRTLLRIGHVLLEEETQYDALQSEEEEDPRAPDFAAHPETVPEPEEWPPKEPPP